MKKKLIPVLTALLVLSLSTTVFAAPGPTASPSTGTSSSTTVTAPVVTLASGATTAITATSDNVVATTVTDAEAQAAATLATAYVPAGTTAQVKAIVDLKPTKGPDADGYYSVTVTVPTLNAGANVFVLHIFDNGTTEQLAATVGANGVVSFKTQSFSKFAVVETNAIYSPDYYAQLQATAAAQAAAAQTTSTATTPTSPKTGGATAAMSIMALISLAGTAVCTKKSK